MPGLPARWPQTPRRPPLREHCPSSMKGCPIRGLNHEARPDCPWPAGHGRIGLRGLLHLLLGSLATNASHSRPQSNSRSLGGGWAADRRGRRHRVDRGHTIAAPGTVRSRLLLLRKSPDGEVFQHFWRDRGEHHARACCRFRGTLVREFGFETVFQRASRSASPRLTSS